MSVIDDFLSSEEYSEYLKLTPEEIEDLFIQDPKRAEKFDAVYEAEFFQQQKNGSKMHSLFESYMKENIASKRSDLYIAVGGYMNDVYKQYFEQRYPGFLEAYMSYGICYNSGMFDATVEYVGEALFLDIFDKTREVYLSK